MALIGSDLKARLATASAVGTPQPDPNASIGGSVSSTPVHTVESTITSVESIRAFTDSAIADPLPPPAPSPDARTILEDSGAYTGFTDQLIHWWRFGLDGDDIGKDYGIVPTTDGLIDAIADGVGISSTDLVSVQPGQFNQQRKSLELDGTSQGCWADFGARIGVAGWFSIQAWVRPTSVAAGVARIVDWDRAAGLENNRFTIERNGSDLRVRQTDQGSSLTIREEVYAGFFSVNTWVCIGVVYNQSISGEDRLKVWKNGVLTAKTGGNVTNAVRTDQNTDLSHGSNVAASSQWFQGQLHSVALWLSVVSDAAMAELAGFGDGAAIPDPPQTDYTGAWVTFPQGANALAVRRISEYDSDTGAMVFDGNWPSLPSVSDPYYLAEPGHLFDAITASEARDGDSEYRLVFMRNDMGVQMNAYRCYLLPIDTGPVAVEAACGTAHSNADVESIPNDKTEPNITTDIAFTAGAKPQSFLYRVDYAQAEDSPRDGLENCGGSSQIGLWLKRSVRPFTGQCDKSVWLLVIEGTNAGGDPDPIRGIILLAFDTSGVLLTKTAKLDRALRIGGGCRVNVDVTDTETGIGIPGEGVTIELVPPSPGSIVGSGALFETDEFGRASTVYHAPTDEGEEGNPVTIRVKV